MSGKRLRFHYSVNDFAYPVCCDFSTALFLEAQMVADVVDRKERTAVDNSWRAVGKALDW